MCIEIKSLTNKLEPKCKYAYKFITAFDPVFISTYIIGFLIYNYHIVMNLKDNLLIKLGLY